MLGRGSEPCSKSTEAILRSQDFSSVSTHSLFDLLGNGIFGHTHSRCCSSSSMCIYYNSYYISLATIINLWEDHSRPYVMD